jgi:hypothetical protein
MLKLTTAAILVALATPAFSAGDTLDNEKVNADFQSCVKEHQRLKTYLNKHSDTGAVHFMTGKNEYDLCWQKVWWYESYAREFDVCMLEFKKRELCEVVMSATHGQYVVKYGSAFPPVFESVLKETMERYKPD